MKDDARWQEDKPSQGPVLGIVSFKSDSSSSGWNYFTPSSQMEKLRPREVKFLIYIAPLGKWQDQDKNPDFIPKPPSGAASESRARLKGR